MSINRTERKKLQVYISFFNTLIHILICCNFLLHYDACLFNFLFNFELHYPFCIHSSVYSVPFFSPIILLKQRKEIKLKKYDF